MLKYISKYVSSTFLVLLSLFMMSCNNLTTPEGTTELVVVNNTETNIRFVVGDYSNVETNHLGDDHIDVYTTSPSKTFEVTTLKSVNIWYLDHSYTILTLLTETDLFTPIDFQFEEDRTYTLTLTDTSFSLVDDLGVTIGVDNGSSDDLGDETDDGSDDEPQDTYSYKITTVSRNSALDNDEDSMNAERVTPISATITRVEKYYGSTTIRITAAFRYDGDIGDRDFINNVKARFYLKDESGNSLYDSTLDGGDGFNYCYTDYTSRYNTSFDEDYRYRGTCVFKGDYVYLTWLEYISSSDTDNPLNSIDITEVSEINFDLVATVYSSLEFEKFAEIDGIVETHQTLDTDTITSVLTNRSMDKWYQLRVYGLEFILFDINNNILGITTGDVDENNSLLVGPNSTTSIICDIPSALQGLVDHAVVIIDYDEGTDPFTASVRAIAEKPSSKKTISENNYIIDLEADSALGNY